MIPVAVVHLLQVGDDVLGRELAVRRDITLGDTEKDLADPPGSDRVEPDTGQLSCISHNAPAATRRAGALADTQSGVAEEAGAPMRVFSMPRFSPTSRVSAVGDTALAVMPACAPRIASALVRPMIAALAVA